jgi:hypothetical protein
MAFSSKTIVMIQFLHNLALFIGKKRQIFCQIFRRQYSKNHNIGPWKTSLAKKGFSFEALSGAFYQLRLRFSLAAKQSHRDR